MNRPFPFPLKPSSGNHAAWIRPNLWRFPDFLQNGLCRFTDTSITKFLNTKGQLLPEEYFSAIRRIFPVKFAPFFLNGHEPSHYSFYTGVKDLVHELPFDPLYNNYLICGHTHRRVIGEVVPGFMGVNVGSDYDDLKTFTLEV